ncbi:ATP-grasp domain-containing protein [Methylosoma difficile]
MAADLVRQAGHDVLVIDCFADSDTQAIAEAVIQIPSLALPMLQDAVETLVESYVVIDVIYGSGFETYPESLDYLHSRFNLIGNSPETFRRLLDKPAFFALLDTLQIPYPAVSFALPELTEKWLLKPQKGQGGVGIRFYQADSIVNTGDYWQKLQSGSAHSVLFLADGKQARVIGFNRQWTQSLENQPFAFAGICTVSDVSLAQQAQVNAWLAKLVPALSLKGLNSLDFIQDDQYLYLLEINPRLSASVQLYVGDWFCWHCLASKGQLPDVDFKPSGHAAYQIVFAEHAVLIPDCFRWPEGCCDLPPAGALVRKGEPICSIIAHQTCPDQLRQTLLSTQQLILKGLYPYGI